MALCAGVGGLDLGLRLALGESYRTVVYVEREAYAASTLVARMEDEALDPAPVWDDLLTFDGRPWRGVVDLVTAGFPCQPFSVAGKRKGTEDERWIWPDVARVIREVGPRYVFLENVPGLLSHGLGHVLGDLAALGLDAEWGVFSAAEVGAPHRRERVFILAHAVRARGGEQRTGRQRVLDVREGVADAAGGGATAAEQPGRLRGVVEGDAAVAYAERPERWPLDERGGRGGERRDVAREAAGRDRGGRQALAIPEHGGQPGLRSRDDVDGRDAPGGDADGRDPAVAHADRGREGSGRGGQPRGRADAADGGATLSDAGESGLPDAELEAIHGARRREEGGATRQLRGALPPFPPGPGDAIAWGAVLAIRPDLAPALAIAHGDGRLRASRLPGHREDEPEQRTDLGGSDGGEGEDGEAEPRLRGLADGMAPRVDRLRSAGNGVVPVVAALAFITLVERLEVNL